MVMFSKGAVKGSRAHWLTVATCAVGLVLAPYIVMAGEGGTSVPPAPGANGVTGQTPGGQGTGTAAFPGTPSAADLQAINSSLTVEQLLVQFYSQNSSKGYLSGSTPVVNPTTGTTADTTTSSTTANTTTNGTTDNTTTNATTNGTTSSNTTNGTTTGTTSGNTTDNTTNGTTNNTTTNSTTNGTTNNTTDNTTSNNTTSNNTTTNSTTSSSTTSSTTTGGTAPAQENPPTTSGSTTSGSTASRDALRAMVTEFQNHHQVHVALLQQGLGTNAQPAATFQNTSLDAASLDQFLTMAITLEDFAVSVHQQAILTGFTSQSNSTTSSGTTTSTTSSNTTTSSTSSGTTTGSTGSTTVTPVPMNQNAVSTLLGIALDDARHAGALRAFRRTVSTAEGGNPNQAITDEGALNVPRTQEQITQFLQPYLGSGTTTNGTTSSNTTNGTTNNTTSGNTTNGTTNGTTDNATTNNTTTNNTTTNNTTTNNTTTDNTTTNSTTSNTTTGTTTGV